MGEFTVPGCLCYWLYALLGFIFLVLYLGWKRFRITTNWVVRAIWNAILLIRETCKDAVVHSRNAVSGYLRRRTNFEHLKEAYFFVFLMFALTFVTYFLATFLKEVYTNNFDEYFKVYFGLGLAVLLLILYLIMVLFHLEVNSWRWVILPFVFYVCLIFFEQYKFLVYVVLALTFVLYPLIIIGTWNGKINWILMWFLLTSSLLLFLGFIAIQSQFGEQKIVDYPLNYCNTASDRSDWELDCTNDATNKLISGYYLKCDVIPKENVAALTNVKGTVSFDIVNESNFTYNFRRFTLPENVVRTKFDITGNSTQGEVCLSMYSTLIKIPTYEEYKENKDKFITYFVTLLGLVFFTFPFAIREYEKLLQGGNDEEKDTL